MTQQIDSDMSSSNQQQNNETSQALKISKKGDKCKGKIIINISNCQYPVVSRVAKSLKWKLQSKAEAMDWDVFWTDNAVPPQFFVKMEPHQKINHFPGMFNLARKNLMGRYLMKMRKKFPNDYSFFPLTWMLPIQYNQLKIYYQSKQKGKARTFIVKPQALSQGKGIFLTRKIQEIDQNAHCVVQRYMHRPYLIEGLKFDLRVYVLVASVDPLKIFIYNEGLTRFATQKYEAPTKQNMQDVCMHLTNYAINKDNPKFVFNSNSKDMSIGHKRSLTWLLQYLQKNDPKGSGLKQKIQDMIVKTMISGLPPIKNTYRSCQPENYASNMCFQLLGFDVMLTQKCQPVLLQINHTPSFSTDTPLDDVIKTNYIRDSLVLMNINLKNKQMIIKQKKEACQQRVITGKKIKLTNQQKLQQRRKAQFQQSKHQSKNFGGFRRIFPVQDEDKMTSYNQFLSYSQENYLNTTGIKKNSFINKKAQKTQSAFGTCFRPKTLNKNSKNRQNALKSILQDTKIDSMSQTKQSYKYSKNLTHSQNIIPRKRLSENDEIRQLQPLQQAFDNYNSKAINKIFSEQMQRNFDESEKICQQNQLEALQIKINAQNKNPFQKSINKRDNQLGKKDQNTIFAQNQKFAKVLKKNDYQLRTACIDSPKTRDSNLANIKNVQIFFDLCQSTNKGQAFYDNKSERSAENLKLAIHGGNKKIFEDRKMYKPQICNSNCPKSSSNINMEAKPKQRHLSNREKIPIMLNTLLISGCDPKKPSISVNNLRKILNNQSK